MRVNVVLHRKRNLMSKVFENVYIFIWTVCILYYTQRSQSGAMHFERVLGESEWERDGDGDEDGERECDGEFAL